MERYVVVPEKHVPAMLRRSAWEVVDDLAELLGLPIVVEFVRAAQPNEKGDYVSPVPIAGGADPARSVVVLRADLSWNAAQIERVVAHEFGHLAIARLGRQQSERHADLLGEYLARQLWRFRLAKLRARRKRLLVTVGRTQDSGRPRSVPAWAQHRPTIEFRTVKGR